MDTNVKEAYVANDNLPESMLSGDVMQVIESACEVLTSVALALSRSSEKLANDHLKRTESSNMKHKQHLLVEANTLKANLLEAENKLFLSDCEASTLIEKLYYLEKQLKSSNIKNKHLLVEANTLKANLVEAENKLQLSDFAASTLREKLCYVEKQLKESDLQLMNAKTSGNENWDLLRKLREMSFIQNYLEERISKAESRADSAEAKCKLLTESNLKLNEELNFLKASGKTSENVEALERQIGKSDIALQSVVASSEASQENQSMLSNTIKDMENVIQKLKLNISKAENLTESAEDKYMVLSECNSELAKELPFLRGRMDCLKESLHQAEELEKATGKEQLQAKRERLQKQMENCIDCFGLVLLGIVLAICSYFIAYLKKA